MKNFNFKLAKRDIKMLKDLKLGAVEDDEDLFMTSLWINKLVVAIGKEKSMDSDSEIEWYYNQ